MEAISLDLLGDLVLRWLHVISSIAWLGLIYFYNFVYQYLQMVVFDRETNRKVTPLVLSRALGWVQWTSSLTFFLGLALYLKMYWWTGSGFGPSGYLTDPSGGLSGRSWWIHSGMLGGFVMWAMFTFIAAPTYKVVLPNMEAGKPPTPDQVVKLKGTGVASLLLTGPVVFLMLGTSHFSSLNAGIGIVVALGALVVWAVFKSAPKVKGL
jgi:uncharacterized membrane protein